MKSLYLIILLIVIVSFHAFGAEFAAGGAQPATQNAVQPGDEDVDYAHTGEHNSPRQVHTAPANHQGGIFRNFTETAPGDLDTHKTIIYRGRNNDGKACALELSFNAFGDVRAGRMISGDASLDLDATKVETGRGVQFLLPSIAVIDSTEHLSIPAQVTDQGSCNVTFSFKKRGTEITGMAARRSCNAWGWSSPVLQCVRMKRFAL